MKLNPKVTYGNVEAAPENVGFDVGRIDMLNKHIQSLIDEKLIWSGSYCLWRNGKVFADAAIGSMACSWQGRDKFLPDTLFEIQSVGKVFTAIAILKLAEDGLLYLGQPVREWITEFDVEGFKDITIMQLLTHTSGVCALEGTVPGDDRKWWEYMDENNPDDTWLEAVVRAGLHAKPGEKWIYSIVGYSVLGKIIENATGVKAEDYIRDNIFLPCDMKEIHWRWQGNKELVARYNIANETDISMYKEALNSGWRALAKATYPTYEGVPETAGGQMSTCREMIHLGEMLLRDGCYRGRRVIGKKALELLWTNLLRDNVFDHTYDHNHRMMYGAGVPIYSRKMDLEQMVSEGVIYHEGAGTCMFMVDKEEDFVAMFQTSFRKEFDWNHRAVKGTASIIWSGLK